MRKGRIKILRLILLTPIVLLVVFLLEERIRGKIALARYKRELIANGEKSRHVISWPHRVRRRMPRRQFTRRSNASRKALFCRTDIRLR